MIRLAAARVAHAPHHACLRLAAASVTATLLMAAGCASETSNESMALAAAAPAATAASAPAPAPATLVATGSAPATAESSAAAPTVDATSPESPRDRARREAWEAAIAGIRLADGRFTVTQPLVGGTDLATQAREERRQLERANQRTPAVAAAVRAVRARPDAPRLWIELGESLSHRGRGALATGAFSTALDMATDPLDQFDAHRGLAMLHAGESEWQPAIEDMTRALALAPGDGDAHARLAVWNWYAGDTSAAAKHLTQAEALGGRVPGALAGLIAGQRPQN